MVQPGLSATRLLENLPPRPPTPPRESDHNGILLEPSKLRRTFPKTLGDHTSPENSPSSSADSAQRSSGKSLKRVAWSVRTEYEDSPRKDSTPLHTLRQVPSSGELKPAKSILKPYNGINIVDRRSSITKLAAPHTYPDFATMLDSIVQQLAGEDRSSRIDAYLTLSGVLKASDNVPDARALKDKISLLTQFIQRDMSARNSSGVLDTGLINNALILLAVFLWKPVIAESFSTDFCNNFVEHCINAFKDPDMPKDLVKRLLFTMSQQSFSAKTMTLDRVRRLIETLGDIDNHVRGKSIILGRLGVYRKLLKQTRISMLSNLCWVDNLFTDMTSDTKEVRIPAVAFGFESALLLGTEKQTSRAVMDLFQQDYGEAHYGDYYAERLHSMVSRRQDGHLVPQIWSIAILFLRCLPRQLEQWEYMNTWLHVIERCFNCSDSEIKIQANLAWNRFVFALRLDENTAPSTISILRKVLDVQLNRKLTGKNIRSKEVKQATFGSLCCILYYALRPNSTYAQLDLYWDEYVVLLVGKSLVSSDSEVSETEYNDLTKACEIMGALLDLTPRAWTNNRTNESSLVKAEELPSIDPKWLRKNAQRVFKVLAPLIEKFFLDLKTWESSIFVLWSRFLSSVAAAGAKEVKVSNDAMSSMASIFDLLYRLWERGPKNTRGVGVEDYDHFQKTFSRLVTMTTTTIGILPFTEKLLSVGPQESFAVVATPSHSPFKARGEIKCPLHHLFTLMTRPATDVRCDDLYLRTVREILYPFFEVRKSRRSQIDLLNDLIQLLPHPPSESRASIVLWRALASFVVLALDSRTASGNSSTSSSGSLEQPLGAEYRNIVRILELGVSLSFNTPLLDWKDLFTAVDNQITLEAGESGCAISLIEPLARALNDRSSKIEDMPSLAYCSILVSRAAYPKEKQALEAARRRLWGTSTVGSKSPSFDPYSHLYFYLKYCLDVSYKSLNSNGSEVETELLSAVADMLLRCPATLATSILTNIQDGLALWISDKSIKFGGRASTVLSTSVSAIWTRICSMIAQLPRTDNSLLQSLEPLLCSALESTHKSIVNAAINMWNDTFGNESSLDYSSGITDAFLRLRPMADLKLPSFPKDPEDEVMSTGPSFLDESQDEDIPYATMDFENSRSLRSHRGSPRLEPSPLPRTIHCNSPRMVVEIPQSSSSRKRPFNGTPEPIRRKVAKKNTTPKLRHDDSQIQFAPIDSSPLQEAVLDSQLLTDRQREVKERQTGASAIFTDLRPTPFSRVRSGLSKFNFSPDLPAAKQTGPTKPTTPIFSQREKTSYDNYITSSPTPRRGSVEIQTDSDAFEPPSSPPEPPLQKVKRDKKSSSVFRQHAHETDSKTQNLSSSSPGRAKETLASTDLGPSAQVIEDAVYVEDGDISMSGNHKTIDSALLDMERPHTPIHTNDTREPEQDTAITPNDVFVDALSSPGPPTPLREENPVNHRGDAFPSSLRASTAELSNLLPGNRIGLVNNLSNQHDIQTSFALSEGDEDSMLRLVTKYDSAAPQHNDSFMAGNSDLIQSSLLSEINTVSEAKPSKKYNEKSAAQPRKMATDTTLSVSSLKDPRRAISALRSPGRAESNITEPSGAGIKKKNQLRRSSHLTSIAMAPSTIPETPVRESLLASQSINGTMGSDQSSPLQIAPPSSTDFEIEMQDSVDIVNVNIDTSYGASNLMQKPSAMPKMNPAADDEVGGIEAGSSEKWTSSTERSQQNSKGDMPSGKDQATVVDLPPASPMTGQKVLNNFSDIINALKSVALTRDEAQKVENLLWDVKGELYAAEKRGRTEGG